MRERSRRKAISPIIATLILIVITVVAGIMLYGFVSGFMANLGTSRTIAPISIASASVNSSGSATIVVSNLGTTPVTITQVNLLNASTGALLVTFKHIDTSPSSTSTSTSVTIAGGNTTTIYASTVASGSMPYVGKTVLVQVVTSTGSYAEAYTTVS
jgi:flagellin-like protein